MSAVSFESNKRTVDSLQYSGLYLPARSNKGLFAV